MSSPVSISLLNFIKIERNSNIPYYLQLTQQLINAIQRGFLMKGSKLPGTRKVSELLLIHRKTVVAAFEDLQSQGWIEIIPNKGTFIIEQQTTHQKQRIYPNVVTLQSYPEQPGFEFEKSFLLDNPFEKSNSLYQFNDGMPDIRLTNLKDLTGLYSSSIKRKTLLHQQVYHAVESNLYFKEQLAIYLNSSRGLHVSKSQLMTCKSLEMSIYVVSRILLKKDDIVVVPSLNLATANMIFQEVGAKLYPIAIDQDGLQVDKLEQFLKNNKIRFLYVAPQHHYPSTVRLSAERRVKLLYLAKKYDFIIIEDDYAFDYQFEKSTLMPLASADVDGRVIYLGSFAKWLTPSFSVGFVVAPKAFIEETYKYLGLLDRQGDTIMEQVLAEMIAEGNIHRHLKKSLKIYLERRELLNNLLTNNFSKYLNYQKPISGLAFWLNFNQKIPLLKLASNCLSDNLFIPKNLMYQDRNLTAIRLGFGHFNEEEMKSSMEIFQYNISNLYD